MRKLVPVIMALIGLAGGVGAGKFLATPEVADDAKTASGASDTPHDGGDATPDEHDATLEYVKLNNQFVIPTIENGQVSALVILSLSLEVKQGSTERVYEMEPKLRDGFLSVLFNHANAGGFRGAFTDSGNLDALRRALLESARSAIGNDVSNILIADIVRQDSA